MTLSRPSTHRTHAFIIGQYSKVASCSANFRRLPVVGSGNGGECLVMQHTGAKRQILCFGQRSHRWRARDQRRCALRLLGCRERDQDDEQSLPDAHVSMA